MLGYRLREAIARLSMGGHREYECLSSVLVLVVVVEAGVSVAIASARTFSRLVMGTPSGDEGLSKVRCRNISRFGHLYSQCSSVCCSSGT